MRQLRQARLPSEGMKPREGKCLGWVGKAIQHLSQDRDPGLAIGWRQPRGPSGPGCPVVGVDGVWGPERLTMFGK